MTARQRDSGDLLVFGHAHDLGRGDRHAHQPPGPQLPPAARRDRGDLSWPELEVPATPGRVLHAIGIPGTLLRL